MKNEVKRVVPNMKTVSDTMKTTFRQRRQWILENHPSVREVLAEYPALALPDMLHQEFHLITGLDADKKLLDVLNATGERCIEMLRSRRLARESLEDFQSELDSLTGDAQKYCFAVGVLSFLPRLVKEKPAFLKGGGAYPCLLYHGEKIYEAENIKVQFEDFEIEVLDIVSGVASLIEVYWVFDMQYSPDNKRTLGVLEYLFGLKHTPLGALAQRIEPQRRNVTQGQKRRLFLDAQDHNRLLKGIDSSDDKEVGLKKQVKELQQKYQRIKKQNDVLRKNI
ncbi:uncharacterized protein LOC135389387 [Ornithodoros turicata]|uniref:uncharacterized protein LOC135389387 n=1 Tax=Ornithodoros turicata TaxID=34597 RepID=UPI003139500B